MRRLLFSAVFLFAFALAAEARVYVYEVVTDENTFQTVSKLEPRNFFVYHGGYAVIKSLKVMQVYKDTEFDRALSEYGLEGENVRYMLHVPPDNSTPEPFSRRPYYWWR